jgi:hypothetical protein
MIRVDQCEKKMDQDQTEEETAGYVPCGIGDKNLPGRIFFFEQRCGDREHAAGNEAIRKQDQGTHAQYRSQSEEFTLEPKKGDRPDAGNLYEREYGNEDMTEKEQLSGL